MEAWQQFVIQMAITLVPVAISYLKQRSKMIALEQRVMELEAENAELRAKHDDLQARYESNLKAQAGMRDKF